ncbi:MAG TPA: hypothetical protein VJB92_02900 [Candidatus Paceibacterota bacterium]
MEEFPTPESKPENFDQKIETLLSEMDGLRWLYNELNEDEQSMWYDVEMEAECGKNREYACGQLEKFMDFLEKEAKKRKGS